MTSKELIHAALQGQPVPRVPTGPLAVHFCAGLAGHSLREYSTNAQALADSVICYYERFRPDAIWLSADTWVSAEAMGARIGATGDEQPLGGLSAPCVESLTDLERIPPPDVSRQGRYPSMVEALQRIVKALGRDVFIVACFDQYPFSLAAALMGLQEIMLKLSDEPGFVQAVMERCQEYALAYACALSEAGADMLSGGDSPAGLAGGKHYEHLILPQEQRLIAGIRAATGKPVSLHICGNTQPILPLMSKSGADVLEIDHAVDLAQACRTAGPNIALWGNLDPVSTLARGTPDEVRQATRKVVAVVKAAHHHRFVLSSGCTLAVGTPSENLQAMLNEAKGGFSA